DHRVPYQISGDLEPIPHLKDYMLLCGSCNRAKSWSCEHCENWLQIRKPELCVQCYWGSPENYLHIALQQMRRIDLTWSGKEVKSYDAIKKMAKKKNIELPELLKEIILNQSKNRT